MTADRVTPRSGTESGRGSPLGADTDLDVVLDVDPGLAVAFRRQLHAELGGRDARPMAEVVARATARGRRRVWIRAGAVVASMAAVATIGVLSATIATDADAGEADSRRAMSPASSGVAESRPGWEARAAEVRIAKAREVIARQLGDLLVALLPPEGTKSAVRTGYSPEYGISAALTWDNGQGPAGVSMSLRSGDLAACAPDAPTEPARIDEYGRTHHLKCVGPLRDAGRFASESVRTTGAGAVWGQGIRIPSGPTVFRLFWAIGPLDRVETPDGKRPMPLTDEQAQAILRDPRWSDISRQLRAAEPGTG
ncbi:hypothetical protein B4N89_31520 [Embleya scabrispora]|uniref:Uncharacterized protein n=1 Tax=Embleya scabrispora TaxID=159449 RepID=A0A1T3NPE6_9ACTN|nr:hypothetical protein [Embleya scabrispora]OPC78696.1 hypothetical protein B4N89_31520 [Embleya scabrispora]